MIILENLIPKGNTAAFYIQYIISTEVAFFFLELVWQL